MMTIPQFAEQTTEEQTEALQRRSERRTLSTILMFGALGVLGIAALIVAAVFLTVGDGEEAPPPSAVAAVENWTFPEMLPQLTAPARQPGIANWSHPEMLPQVSASSQNGIANWAYPEMLPKVAATSIEAPPMGGGRSAFRPE